MYRGSPHIFYNTDLQYICSKNISQNIINENCANTLMIYTINIKISIKNIYNLKYFTYSTTFLPYAVWINTKCAYLNTYNV